MLNKKNFIFFAKTENRKAKQVPLWRGGRGEGIKKGYRRVIMLEILYTHV
jgi:hypothetical protein